MNNKKDVEVIESIGIEVGPNDEVTNLGPAADLNLGLPFSSNSGTIYVVKRKECKSTDDVGLS